MSTHSAIIALIGEKYIGIYCHSDGYVKGVGETLLRHYTDPAKVEQLIALGALSYLDVEVAPPAGVHHSFAGAKAPGVTLAYHRDRGETLHSVSDTLWHLTAKQIDHNGYVYIFEDGKWTVAYDDRSNCKRHSLDKEVARVTKTAA